MRYRSQQVAYWYFAVAMALFGLQIAFGLLSASKYLGPDPLLYILPFDVSKMIHTNLLIVWVLTGFMGATYWLVPEESQTELYSVKLAYVQLGLWAAIGLGIVVGALVYLWARRGDNARFFPVWIGGITTALVGTIIAVPIAAYVFGGVTGGGTDALVALFRTLGLDVLQAVFLQSLLSDPLDKAISYTVVFLILGALPITVRTMYSRGESTVAA